MLMLSWSLACGGGTHDTTVDTDTDTDVQVDTDADADTDPPVCEEPTCDDPTAVLSGDFATLLSDDCALDFNAVEAWRCVDDAGHPTDVVLWSQYDYYGHDTDWFDGVTGAHVASARGTDCNCFCCSTVVGFTLGVVPACTTRVSTYSCW